MPGSFDQRISTIEGKARLLIERYRLVVDQRDEAIRRINELTAELTQCRKQIETLTTRVEYLQISSTIEPSSDNVEQTRHFLSELVWEIDKCIKRLSD